MTVLITLTTVGADCSLFDIYSNIDGFISAFETDVPKSSLSAGFSSANVPDGTTIIRVKAKGVCTNYIDITLSTSTTTTTTTLPATSFFCFEGEWSEVDTTHDCPSLCGQVTYIDAFGNTQTETGITSEMGVISIEAQSIISTIGVNAVTCP
jgi:hypothetical protein